MLGTVIIYNAFVLWVPSASHILEVVKEPEKTKEEYQQAANDFKEQVKQQQANTENPFAGGFGPSAGSGDDIDWDKDPGIWGDNVVIH